jgi:hypothetical protein
MEHNDRISNTESTSYVTLVREMTASAQKIVQNEIMLAQAELREIGPALARHTTQMAAFGTLAVLSVFPLLAFVIIGLGHLMGDQFWLSSLIVGLVCAGIGIPLAYRAFKKMKEEDLKFKRTREGIEHGVHAVKSTVKTIADSLEGDNHYGTNQNSLHH